jgi:acyl carrier protein
LNREEILNHVQNIFRDIFDDDFMIVEDKTNSEEVEDWDSLNHINLVSAIEKELKIKFSLGELTSLKDVGEMVDLIIKKLA